MAPPPTFLMALAVLLLSASSYADVRIPRPNHRLCNVSICFAFDESGSIPWHDPDAFNHAKIVALNIAAAVGSGSYYVGVQYTTTASAFVSTSNYITFANAVVANAFNGGGTDSEDGLEECRRRLASRPTPKVIVLLTDGRDAHLYSVTSTAAALKPEHTIITVNVGPSSNNAALENVASHPSLNVDYPAWPPLLLPNGPFVTHICKPCCEPVSVCFALDESGSISSTEFQDMLDGVVAVTSSHNALSLGLSTYAAAEFATGAGVIQTRDTAAVLINTLQTEGKLTGLTAMGLGLQYCARLLSGAPFPRVIVILSDGFHNSGISPITVANSIVPPYRIVSVGIGGGVDAATLSTIASPNRYIEVNDFPDILAAVGDITKAICESRDARRIVPRPTLPFARCAPVTCARCGTALQCFVRTGSALIDAQVCRTIATDGGFRTAVGACKVGKRLYTSVQCYPSQTFGLIATRGTDGAACQGSVRKAPTSFVRLNVCAKEGDTSVKYSCATKNCPARRKSCRPVA